MEDALKEVCTGLTLTSALHKMVPGLNKKTRIQHLETAKRTLCLAEDMTRLSLFDCAIQYPTNLLKWIQQHFALRLLIIMTVFKKKKRITRLLFDGRHAFVDKEHELHCWALTNDKKLFRYTKNVDHLPALHLAYFSEQRRSPLPLICLIQNKEAFGETCIADPQNKQELMLFLEKHTNCDTKVCIRFDYGTKQKSWLYWYETPTTTFKKVLFIRAYSDCHYKIVYRKEEYSKQFYPNEDIHTRYEEYKTLWKRVKENEALTPDAHQKCRTSSVSLSRTGLNLAYDLGIIKDNLMYLSDALAKTQSSLHVFLDEENHLRFASYYDVEKQFSTQVMCCTNDCSDLDQELSLLEQTKEHKLRKQAADAMLLFWTKIWNRRRRWIERRKYLLKNVMDQLLVFTACGSLHSPYARCLSHLRAIIMQQKIYIYSSCDSHLHAIKYYLAQFAYKTLKRSQGVSIKAQGDGTLTTLSFPGLTVVNLYNYLDAKDKDFYNACVLPSVVVGAGPEPCQVFISHKQKNLRQHYCKNALTYNGKPITLFKYCQEKGKEWSKHVFLYWAEFGLYILKTFSHEVHGQLSYSSASFLGFQCLWTWYIIKSGPLAHALEKTKPYYENLIRQASKGGFMFSIEDCLKKGQPLHKDDDNLIAQSIGEMDVTSAYGFAASRATMPGGFCTGFKKQPQGNRMTCLDEKGHRHRSFEFRAVFKTIVELQKKGTEIRSVYSNYSPRGLFCLGPYPIDLAIVTHQGQLLLYQMDGAFVHGCPACPQQKRYVNGQTHEQVRELTQKRDDLTQAWINKVNSGLKNIPLIQYHVFRDCCTPYYDYKSLKVAFQMEPQLKQLVKGYHLSDSLGHECSMTNMLSKITCPSNTDSTFIMLANVTILNEQNTCGGPLIIYEPRKHTYTRQLLANKGCVVLTRDYLQWLLTRYGNALVFESIEWILFYSKEVCWNLIFHTLVEWRSKTNNVILVAFIKRMINLTSGFFGARTLQQDRTSYRIVHRLPHNYAFYRHFPDMTYTMDVGNDSFFLLETKPWPKVNSYRQASKSALPMFLTIVEYGKLRMVQILDFILQHTLPGYFKLLYSNIDNIIYALANADHIDDIVKVEARTKFNTTRHLFLATQSCDNTHASFAPAIPGRAELKWIRKGNVDWNFITIRTQHYCLVVNNTAAAAANVNTENEADTADEGENIHKTSGWSNLSSREAFNAAINILKGNNVNVLQHRRLNKKSNLLTHQIALKY